MFSPFSDCHCQFFLICTIFKAVFFNLSRLPRLSPSLFSLSLSLSLFLSLSKVIIRKKKHFIAASALIIIQFNHLTLLSLCYCLFLPHRPTTTPHSLGFSPSHSLIHSSTTCLSWVLIKNVFPALPLSTAGSLTHCETGHLKLCSPLLRVCLKAL